MNIHISTIDIENLSVKQEEVSSAFETYIKQYVDQRDRKEKCKVYEISEEYPTLLSCVDKMIEEDEFEQAAMEISNHLLECERIAQRQIYDFETSNKKGTLIQILTDSYYFVCKSEQEAYLEGVCFETQYGVSLDNLANWKSICIPYHKVGDQVFFEDAFAHSVSRQSYWTQSFLGLSERLDDAKNTEVAYRALDQELKSMISPHSKKDYVQLSSQVQDRMQESSELDFNEFVEEIVQDYQPSVENIDKDVVLDCLLALPSRKKFETQFQVRPESVINKRTKKFICAPGIELVVHSDANAYAHKIVSTLSDGKRVLQIICEDEDTYDSFS